MAKSWKAVERGLAARLGGVRQPVSGRQRGDVPDVAHPDLALEVKSRAVIPSWLEEAMQQAEASARNGQLPVALIHEDHRGYATSLVILRLSDFEARFMKNGRLKPNLDPFVSV